MDVVAPPKPVATEPAMEPALATPPPQEAPETDGEAVPAVADSVPLAPQPAPQPVVPMKDKAPKSPGVAMAITATVIIIIVIAGLAVLAYIKR